MNTQHNNKNMSIRELRGRMQRAKKRAIKRAKVILEKTTF